MGCSAAAEVDGFPPSATSEKEPPEGIKVCSLLAWFLQLLGEVWLSPQRFVRHGRGLCNQDPVVSKP